MSKVTRRQILKALSVATGAAAVGGTMSRPRSARAAGDKPTFLIMMPGFGGAAIIDSFLPIKQSEAGSPSTLDCFPDAQVVDIPGSPFRAADAIVTSLVSNPVAAFTAPLSGFAEKHKNEMMVTTLTGTSVNHAIAQRRALSGGGAWGGRTLQELVALTYGEGYPLPNVNMASLGYLEPGADKTLPAHAYAEAIPDPLLKPLSLSASEGILGAPDKSLIELARTSRNDVLDPQSGFYRAFRLSERLELWKKQRSDVGNIEGQDLIKKLIFVEEQPGIPLSDYGLTPSPDVDLISTYFPDAFSAEPDPFEQQAALAFLLIKHRVSVSVTIAPSFAPVVGGPWLLKTPPLAFDGSHNDHRSAQAIMWWRMMSIADRLVDLLKQTVYDEDTGESFWERTMIHMPTDFGRSKDRPSGASIWGTAHNLNNGHVTISPLVNGNTVLGGVNPDDGMTYGFDLESGDADPGRNTNEAESFAGLAQALGIDTSAAGLVDVPAMRKG